MFPFISVIISSEVFHFGRKIILGYYCESRKERDHWEDQGIGEWTILKWILERWDGMVWIGSIWLRIGTSGGLL
jgi:hypothetical protein